VLIRHRTSPFPVVARRSPLPDGNSQARPYSYRSPLSAVRTARATRLIRARIAPVQPECRVRDPGSEPPSNSGARPVAESCPCSCSNPDRLTRISLSHKRCSFAIATFYRLGCFRSRLHSLKISRRGAPKPQRYQRTSSTRQPCRYKFGAEFERLAAAQNGVHSLCSHELDGCTRRLACLRSQLRHRPWPSQSLDPSRLAKQRVLC
jgi:hypothetical protein